MSPALSSKMLVKELSCAGRRVARAEGAPSRDALRGILRGDAKRTLGCALPAPGDGHTRESVFLADNRGHLADMKHKQCHMFASIVRAMSLVCDNVAISKMMLPGRYLRYNR
jgi:hypothetical protein